MNIQIVETNPETKKYSGREILKEPGFYCNHDGITFGILVPNSACKWDDCLFVNKHTCERAEDYDDYVFTKSDALKMVGGQLRLDTSKSKEPTDEFPIKTKPTKDGAYIAKIGPHRYLYFVNKGNHSWIPLGVNNVEINDFGTFDEWRPFTGKVTFQE